MCTFGLYSQHGEGQGNEILSMKFTPSFTFIICGYHVKSRTHRRAWSKTILDITLEDDSVRLSKTEGFVLSEQRVLVSLLEFRENAGLNGTTALLKIIMTIY